MERPIRATDPFNHVELDQQIRLQKKLAWDLESAVDWSMGVDPSKHLLPLDDDSIAFPGASTEQELALSQLMGLIVNATISEMEDSLPKLRYFGWEKTLRDFPTNPEVRELGELFFDEEHKHARAFSRYLDTFCHAVNVDRKDLDSLLPKAFGSFFQKAITSNSIAGGHAFWWVVAAVEEVSISIYHDIFRNRANIDPLFFNLHRRHLEEESRHANYAFLMLNLISQQPENVMQTIHRKADFMFAQLVGAPWVIGELHKFFNVKRFKGVHPFFDTLISCIPLYEKLSKAQVAHRMFISAPYISVLLNWKGRKLHCDIGREVGTFVPPFFSAAPSTPRIIKQ